MFPFRLFPTNFCICIMPPLGRIWHSPFSPTLTSSSGIQAISGEDSNSVGPLACSFPMQLQFKKDKEAVWGSEAWTAHGKWAEDCWTPTLGSPWREPAGKITNSEANAVSYYCQTRFWSGSPNNFVSTRISRDPPSLLILGYLKGRDEEGFSWDSTELGWWSWSPLLQMHPQTSPLLLLLGYLEGWTSRKVEHMQ